MKRKADDQSGHSTKCALNIYTDFWKKTKTRQNSVLEVVGSGICVYMYYGDGGTRYFLPVGTKLYL